VAEPESDYSWVFGLVVLFFMFVLPILKKVADSLAGKKEKQVRGMGPVREKPQKRGVFGEMIDEVEDFFRKSRTQKEEKPGPASRVKTSREREQAPFDVQYRERRREMEERQRSREERRGRRRLETAWQPEQPQPRPPQPQPVLTERLLSEASFKEPLIKPVVEKETKKLSTIGEEFGSRKITSLEEEKKTGIKEESFFEVLGELPETARMIVMSEIFSEPKSLLAAREGI